MARTRPGDEELVSLLYPDEPFSVRALRRTRGIALQVVLFAVLTGAAPGWLLLGALIDLTRRLRSGKPWMAVRLLAFLWWGLFCELRGLVGLSLVRLATIGRRPQLDRRVYRLRRQWLGGHLRGMRRIFGLRFDIDGLELLAGGPVVVLMRHASTVDTLLPETFIGIEHDTWPRYVLKRELLNLPTIDIGRRWVPTVFVRRGMGNIDAELRRLRALTRDLAADEPLIIYPEGTLFSPKKLARTQQIVAQRQPALAPLAARLRHVLPPKVAGPAALLQALPTADVVVFGHHGLDNFEYPRDMWRGDLVGSTVRIKLWRYPAAAVPRDETALGQWLYESWLLLDDWIDSLVRPAEVIPSRIGPA
jgi:1-acyl-sn-glycerol-3-phosphate acyltransferase